MKAFKDLVYKLSLFWLSFEKQASWYLTSVTHILSSFLSFSFPFFSDFCYFVTFALSLLITFIWVKKCSKTKPQFSFFWHFFIFPLVAYLSLLQKIFVSNLTFTSFISLISGLYGVLFEKHKEAAFANYRLWESCGFVIAFGYSTTLQVYIKLYILLAVLLLSMVTYGVVEYLETKSSPGTPTATKKENVGPHTQETKM